MGKGVKTAKLPFEETGTESTTPTDPYGDIAAYRNWKPDNRILDAATTAQYDQANEEADRGLNSVYSAGLPLAYRQGRSMKFQREMGQNRGLALAAGQEGLNRVVGAQKAGVAGLTRGVNTVSHREGYSTGIPGQSGNAAAGISAAGIGIALI